MKIIKYYCDKCGDRISTNCAYYRTITIEQKEDGSGSENLHFCGGCWKGFIRWLCE